MPQATSMTLEVPSTRPPTSRPISSSDILPPTGMLVVHRTALRRRLYTSLAANILTTIRHYHPTWRLQDTRDPRLSNLGNLIEDDFAVLRSSYQVPKHPIILAHGLLGFDELHIGGSVLPGVKYWRGITDALAEKGVEVVR